MGDQAFFFAHYECGIKPHNSMQRFSTDLEKNRDKGTEGQGKDKSSGPEGPTFVRGYSVA